MPPDGPYRREKANNEIGQIINKCPTLFCVLCILVGNNPAINSGYEKAKCVASVDNRVSFTSRHCSPEYLEGNAAIN